MKLSQKKIEELINRYKELEAKYNSTKSMALKGHYEGEMSWIAMVLASENRSDL